ncbi:hypothetical protein [Kribbella sp. NPDC049584]|uniref:hypothetical protein n=1 Tax=Kribbella sp. NPDC049584 TaxID=3154833 RepID=UPI00343C9371
MLTVYEGFRDRRAQRARETLNAITERVTPEHLAARLERSEELDAVFGLALSAAANSASAAKRRTLGAVVARAVLDDAMIDEAALRTTALSQIDAPHVRCLEDIHRIQKAVEDAGERPRAAAGAERENNQRILDVARRYPTPVLLALTNVGLLDATPSWDGQADRVRGLTVFGEAVLSDLHQYATELGPDAT